MQPPYATASSRRIPRRTCSRSRKASTTSGSNWAPALGEDLGRRVVPAARRPVRPVARDRVERVGDGEDAGGQRDVRAREAVRVAEAVPPLVVAADDAQPVAVQEVDVPEQLLSEHRVRAHQPQLRVVQRPALLEDVVRDPDLAHVVEQEPVLDARVHQELWLDRLRELDRVALYSLRVEAGAEVLGLERARERGDGLPVRPLQELLPAALDLEQAAQVVRVQQQLLVPGRGSRGPERPLVEAAGEALDDREQLERAERLAQERIRARAPRRLLGLLAGSGQEDDADPARRPGRSSAGCRA